MHCGSVIGGAWIKDGDVTPCYSYWKNSDFPQITQIPLTRFIPKVFVVARNPSTGGINRSIHAPPPPLFPPNSPETNFTGRSKESFLILSLIHGRSVFHSGWLFSEMKGLYVYTFQVTTYPGSFQKFSNEISTGYAFLLVPIQCRIHFEDRIIYFARTTDCLFVMCVTFSQWKPDPDTDSGKWCPRIEFSSSSNWKISLYCLASIVVGEPVGEENFCASWIDDNGNNWKLILYDRCTNC